MKRFMLFFIGMLLAFGPSLLAQTTMNDEKMPAKVEPLSDIALNAVKENEPTGTVFVGNKFCPVDADVISTGTQAQFEYQGKIYNFCSPLCIETFKKDPETCIKKLAEKVKKVSLEEAAKEEAKDKK